MEVGSSNEAPAIEVSQENVDAMEAVAMLEAGEYDSSNPPSFEAPEVEQEVESAEEEFEQEEETEEYEEETESEDDESEPFFSEDVIQFINNEYAELGGLSQDTVDALQEFGIPEYMIDTYLQGLSAIEALNEQAAFNMVGGEENYQAIMDWASEALSESEIDVFNNAVSGDPAAFQMALSGLAARYEQAYGSAGYGAVYGYGTETADVFSSTQEVVTAMSDPRYGKDLAYTNGVAQKLQRSNVF